jgi:hypothetical protein
MDSVSFTKPIIGSHGSDHSDWPHASGTTPEKKQQAGYQIKSAIETLDQNH